MKIRTKLAIIALATFLTLAGFNLLAGAFISTGVVETHGAHPSVTVEVTNFRVLA